MSGVSLYITLVRVLPCRIPPRDVGLDCILLNSCPHSIHFQTIYLANILGFFVFDVYNVLSIVEVLQPTACAIYFGNFITTGLV